MVNIVFDTEDHFREYFCKSCHQLRLCLDDSRINCGNCGSFNLVWGELNKLDKQKEIAKCHSI